MLRTFKRFLLSASIVGLFALYTFQQQMHPLIGTVTTSTNANQVVAVIAPTRASSTSSQDHTTTGSSSDEEHEGSEADNEEDDAENWTAPTSPARIADAPTATTTTAQPNSTTACSGATGTFKDGAYTGVSADASWGNVKVQVTIANGQISDVAFLTYPNHRNRSVDINDNAMPILVQEAISAQSSQIDIVSGATDTSDAFIQSLGSALQQAAA